MRIRVEGHAPLNGVYHPSGNPNAAQALIAAALLAETPSTLTNMPRTLSTLGMIAGAESIGVQASWADETTVTLDPTQLMRRPLVQGETDSSFGVLLFIAPMLARRGFARLEVDFPPSRIRTHLEALRDLGVDVVVGSSGVELQAKPWEHKRIVLGQASVTATAMALMLAARLGKETMIYGAACEPHVQQLAHFLIMMGARIDGVGSNLLTVHGVNALQGAQVTVAGDHVEAGSVAALAALCGGRVQVQGVAADDMRLISRIFWRLGITLELDHESIFVPKHESLSVSNREEDVDSSIETAPWPGFPSDLVAIATLIATQARGTSLIHEKLFNNRLLFVDKLKAMGGQIVLCDPHRAIVMGATPLHGIYMDSPDVRTGLGMLAAALVAERESVIDNAQALEHTFGGVIGRLQALGARIILE